MLITSDFDFEETDCIIDGGPQPISDSGNDSGTPTFVYHFGTTYLDFIFIFFGTVPKGYASLGPPTEFCRKCNAVMSKEERANKNVKKGTPNFSLCCGQGQIKLPPTPATPSYLKQLYGDRKKSSSFRRNIRLYNSMFAFTSMGGKVDNSINCGRTPYVY